MERTLLISLGDTVVGHLWGDGIYTHFSFHQQYLDMPDRPVLGQYFEDRLQKTIRRIPGMHPWFENLLPERAGALRNHYSRSLGLDSSDSMGLLAALGDDLPGAVRAHCDTKDPPVAEVIDEDRADPLGAVRFSLGGMQLKFSLSGEPSRLSLRVSDDAGAAWILKLGTPEYPGLAENEHAIMSWCRASGFDVPETHVVPVSQLPDLGPLPEISTAYLIRRYDRESRVLWTGSKVFASSFRVSWTGSKVFASSFAVFRIGSTLTRLACSVPRIADDHRAIAGQLGELHGLEHVSQTAVELGREVLAQMDVGDAAVAHDRELELEGPGGHVVRVGPARAKRSDLAADDLADRLCWE